MLNLTDVFYDLYNSGYIYDEDENGHNMSYGELAAISDYFWGLVEEELESYYTFEEKIDAFTDIVNSADDDTLMFWNWDGDFYFEIDEDAGTYDFDGTLPYCLKDAWEDFVATTDLTPSEYSREPKFI